MQEESGNRLTLDGVLDLVHEIARNGDGPDRFRALKLITTIQHVGGPILPRPLTDHELVDKLAVLLNFFKCTGKKRLARAAWSRVFGKESGLRSVKDLRLHLPAEYEIKLNKVRELKSLYRICPGLKRPGVPTGYPFSGGPLERQEFCQRLAAAYFSDEITARASTVPQEESSP